MPRPIGKLALTNCLDKHFNHRLRLLCLPIFPDRPKWQSRFSGGWFLLYNSCTIIANSMQLLTLLTLCVYLGSKGEFFHKLSLCVMKKNTIRMKVKSDRQYIFIICCTFLIAVTTSCSNQRQSNKGNQVVQAKSNTQPIESGTDAVRLKYTTGVRSILEDIKEIFGLVVTTKECVCFIMGSSNISQQKTD